MSRIVVPSRHRVRVGLGLLVALAWAMAWPPPTVGAADATRDPRYREVLFYFYQDDPFAALTRLLTLRDQGVLGPYHDEAELLLGGLYLAHGLYDAAGQVFQTVLDRHPDVDVRRRAWLYLAKAEAQCGHAGAAWDALARVGDHLPVELRGERAQLVARLWMAHGDLDRAIAALDGVAADGSWLPYLQYNLAIALLRHGDRERGLALLDRVGQGSVPTPDQAALRDKANLVAGYTLLDTGELLAARATLERVRLDGPFSAKALLAVGWVAATGDDYARAAVSWAGLQGRDRSQPAVQEALLALPYALAKRGDPARAAARYGDAIAAIQEQQERLAAAVAAVRAGIVVERLAAGGLDVAAAWTGVPRGTSDRTILATLLPLLAGQEFHAVLADYRDLRRMATNLDGWQESVAAFDEMLATRRRGYQERLPRVQASDATIDLAALRARCHACAARLAEVIRRGDASSLASPQERRLAARLAAVKERLAALAAEAAPEARDRQRLLAGVLLWQTEQAYPARLWQVRKGLRQVDTALAAAETGRESLRVASQAAPASFAGYGERIAGLRRRLEVARRWVAALADERRHLLEARAIAALEARQQRLTGYLAQARFAQARLYDAAARVEVAP